MYLSKTVLFLPLLLSLAAAVPVAEAEASPDLAVRAPELLKRGFGCPFNRQACNDHVCYLISFSAVAELTRSRQCITLKGGRTGGYCAGFFRL